LLFAQQPCPHRTVSLLEENDYGYGYSESFIQNLQTLVVLPAYRRTIVMAYKDREKQIAYSKLYNEQHKEERKAWRRVHTIIHQERLREYRKQYNAEHRKENSAQHKEYTAKNREKINASAKKYRESHPEQLVINHARRRARLANIAVKDLSAAQWREIKDAYQHRCAYCGKKQKRLTMDHITPVIHDGCLTVWNIVPSCKSCNSKKNTGPPLIPVQPLLLTIAPSKR
jgi:rubrerythrin